MDGWTLTTRNDFTDSEVHTEYALKRTHVLPCSFLFPGHSQ